MPNHKKPLNLRIIGLLIFALLSTIFVYHRHLQNSDCVSQYRQDSVILTPDGTQLAVEIAADPHSQIKGLGGRECIADGWGMLFSFKDSDVRQFWMKDMKFPIDIVWIDEDFKVVGVAEDVSPDSYPQTFSSQTPVKHVLELGAYQAGALSLVPGSTVTF